MYDRGPGGQSHGVHTVGEATNATSWGEPPYVYKAHADQQYFALGGAILLLRAAGEQIGWAFQLQEPLVVAALFQSPSRGATQS